MAERLTRDLVLGAINRLLKVWVAETAPNHLSEGQRVSGEIEGDLRHESPLGGHWPEIVAWILGWDLPRTYTVVEELPSSAVFLAELGRRFSPLLVLFFCVLGVVLSILLLSSLVVWLLGSLQEVAWWLVCGCCRRRRRVWHREEEEDAPSPADAAEEVFSTTARDLLGSVSSRVPPSTRVRRLTTRSRNRSSQP